MPNTSDIQRRISRFWKERQSATRQRKVLSEAQRERARQARASKQRRAQQEAEAQRSGEQPSRFEALRAQAEAAAAERKRAAKRRLAQRQAAAQAAAAAPPKMSALREKLATPAARQWSFRAVSVIAVCSVAANFVQYFRYSPSRPLVTVGHRVVSHGEYLADLDGAAGKQVLSRIVYGELILQGAAKAGLLPTPQDVDARIADLRRQSQQALPSDDVLYDQVRTQMALENLRLQGITATEAEVTAFYDQHKAQLAVPGRVNTTIVVTQSAADAARATKDLADGETEAQIAAEPGMHVGGVNGFNINLSALPAAQGNAIKQAAVSLPLGTSRTFRIGPTVYLTLEPHSRDAGGLAPLSQMHDQVARLVRLQKAPTEAQELATLYHASPPSFQMARYASYFSDVPPAAPANAVPSRKTASLPGTNTTGETP